MNLFRTKDKAAKQPYQPVPDAALGSVARLRGTKSTADLRKTEQPRRHRSSSLAQGAASPPLPGKYTAQQANFYQKPAPKGPAMQPSTVTRSLTPPDAYYDDPADEPPEDDAATRIGQATLETAQDDWEDQQYWAPTPRPQVRTSEPTQPPVSATPPSSPQAGVTTPKPTRRPIAERQPTPGPAPKNVPPMSPSLASGSRGYSMGPGAPRPTEPLRVTSPFAPPPVSLTDMRVHAEAVPSRPNTFAVELRFNINVREIQIPPSR